MNRCLLNVSTLLALSWPGHASHEPVQRWFARNATKGWATCPMVEAGFVRIICNPAFSPRAVSPADAVSALRGTVSHPAHQFWSDDISFVEAVSLMQGPLSGHQQVTDAYLVALAIHHRGRLATLDRRMAQLAPAGAVEVIA